MSFFFARLLGERDALHYFVCRAKMSRMDRITVAEHADAGIGQFSVVGRVTPAHAGAVLARNDRWVKAQRLAGQVVSYRAAEVAIEPEVLCSNAKRIVGAGARGLLIPTALLVHPDHLPMWRNYCWMMAQTGIVRAAFTDFTTARRWTEEAAALWEAQAVHRRRERSHR